MKIASIKQQSLADIVEERIIESIRESGLKPGDSLPGELDFANSLGVSRNVVREAFSRLRMLGVLESRKKRGMILKQANIINGFERVLSLPVLGTGTQNDLFELRLMIEMGIIDFVFLKKTKEDLNELEKIVNREEKNTGNHMIRIECDIMFHTKLYQITQNKTLESFQNLLNSFFQTVIKSNSQEDHTATSSKVSHHDLLNELTNGSLETYRQLMHKHLQIHINRNA